MEIGFYLIKLIISCSFFFFFYLRLILWFKRLGVYLKYTNCSSKDSFSTVRYKFYFINIQSRVDAYFSDVKSDEIKL